MEKVKNSNKGETSFFLSILKGSLASLCISLIGILIFAFLIRFISIPDSAISPINQVIKGVSILIGCFIGLKKTNEMGFISGLLIGVFYTIKRLLKCNHFSKKKGFDPVPDNLKGDLKWLI